MQAQLRQSVTSRCCKVNSNKCKQHQGNHSQAAAGELAPTYASHNKATSHKLLLSDQQQQAQMGCMDDGHLTQAVAVDPNQLLKQDLSHKHSWAA